MPKNESAKTVNRFHTRIRQALDYHQELRLAVHNKTKQASLETMLAEQCALSMGVLWEAFVHDLLLTYVMVNPSVCMKDLEKRLKQSLEAKVGPASKWVKFGFPRVLTKAQLAGIVDPKGWNITAGSAEDLAKLANQLLTASDAKKFSLGAEDGAFVNFLIGLRNYLSHRSTASRAIVAKGIAALHGSVPNSPLVGPVKSIGAYLKQAVPGHSTRASFIGARLIDVSEKLR
jgi:hypothetical protein